MKKVGEESGISTKPLVNLNQYTDLYLKAVERKKWTTVCVIKKKK